MTDGVWVVRPAEWKGIQGNSANTKEGKVMFLLRDGISGGERSQWSISRKSNILEVL